MKALLIALSLLFAGYAIAGPILVDPHTGKYLGNLNTNRFDTNSVSNPFGRFGSKFSPDSINNRFGKYGSKFSPDSANNPFSSGVPVIIHPRHR